MTTPDMTQLEHELLAAQKEKVLAEIAVLRKSTPLTEAIKVLGSMFLGAGGAVAGFAGFQLAEVKAEKHKLEAAEAQTARDNAKSEMATITTDRDKKKKEIFELNQRLEVAKKDFATISDNITKAKTQCQGQAASATLQDIQQNANASYIDMHASLYASFNSSSVAPLDSVIENLFSPTASVRGNAYDELIARFSKSPDLVPRLLNFAAAHMDNQNGVYNTLVVLSHLDHRALRSDLAAIRNFANQARTIGPRTAERSDKVLERLPQ